MSILNITDTVDDYRKAFQIVEVLANQFSSKDTMENIENIILQRKKTEIMFLNDIHKSLSNEKIQDDVNIDKLFNLTGDKNIGIRCPNCNEYDTIYKTLQNRSADEGMSSFCKCRTCSHQWVIRS